MVLYIDKELMVLGRSMMLFLDPEIRKYKNKQKEVEGIFLLIHKRVIEWGELGDYCHDCFNPLSYDESFDACYCSSCNEWREEACEDPTCIYCDVRPKRPL